MSEIKTIKITGGGVRPYIEPKVIAPKGFVKIGEDLIRLDSIIAVRKQYTGFVGVYLEGGEIFNYSSSSSLYNIAKIIQSGMEEKDN